MGFIHDSHHDLVRSSSPLLPALMYLVLPSQLYLSLALWMLLTAAQVERQVVLPNHSPTITYLPYSARRSSTGRR